MVSSLVERQSDLLGLDAGAAHLDLHHRTERGVRRRNVAHGDRRAEGRRWGATRDDTNLGFFTRLVDRVAMAGDPAAAHDHADELLYRSLGGDALQRRTADEVTRLVELHDASKSGFERVGVQVELIAIE